MAANSFTFNQLATVLNSIQAMATGTVAIAPVDTSSFVTVAKKTLETAGYDFVLNAISQVISKTIFSVRPYTRKFGGLKVDAVAYGNHVRKLNALDSGFVDDPKYGLTDGQSIDQYTVSKPRVLQTNFYGQNIFMKSLTIFKDQLDVAFSGPEQFGNFLTMIMSNASDQIEQAHENVARATLANFIMGKIATIDGNTIHLVKEYNAFLGVTDPESESYMDLTALRQPDKYKPFMAWVYARIAELSSMMTERSIKFHTNISGNEINRHTPMENQKVYILASNKFENDALVLADTYHDNYIRYADYEAVSFWQSIYEPAKLDIKPIYLAGDGSLTTSQAAIVQDNVFGVIFDEEAVGYTTINESVDLSPYNAKGKYWNQFWHFTDRYWNDFTENGVVLLLD